MIPILRHIYFFCKSSASASTKWVTPFSPALNHITSFFHPSHTGPLSFASSLRVELSPVPIFNTSILAVLEWDWKEYVDTVYNASLPSAFGVAADLRGAEINTSGVKVEELKRIVMIWLSNLILILVQTRRKCLIVRQFDDLTVDWASVDNWQLTIRKQGVGYGGDSHTAMELLVNKHVICEASSQEVSSVETPHMISDTSLEINLVTLVTLVTFSFNDVLLSTSNLSLIWYRHVLLTFLVVAVDRIFILLPRIDLPIFCSKALATDLLLKRRRYLGY